MNAAEPTSLETGDALLALLAAERQAMRRLDFREVESLTLEKERLVQRLREGIEARTSSVDTALAGCLKALGREAELNAVLLGETLRAVRQHLGLVEAGTYDRSARRSETRSHPSGRSA